MTFHIHLLRSKALGFPFTWNSKLHRFGRRTGILGQHLLLTLPFACQHYQLQDVQRPRPTSFTLFRTPFVKGMGSTCPVAVGQGPWITSASRAGLLPRFIVPCRHSLLCLNMPAGHALLRRAYQEQPLHFNWRKCYLCAASCMV